MKKLWLKIPIRALKLAHNLGQLCPLFVTAPPVASCVTAEPDWAKGHYRLAAALLGAKDLCGALGAADAAEKLDPLLLYTNTKQAALELLLDAQRRGGCAGSGGIRGQEEGR